jgi:hypothetical protein
MSLIYAFIFPFVGYIKGFMQLTYPSIYPTEGYIEGYLTLINFYRVSYIRCPVKVYERQIPFHIPLCSGHEGLYEPHKPFYIPYKKELERVCEAHKLLKEYMHPENLFTYSSVVYIKGFIKSKETQEITHI